MGAGQGKMRRVLRPGLESGAQAKAAVNRASFDRAKWEKFVAESGLERVRISDYPLGRDAEVTVLLITPHQKMVTELFQDAVAVGALTLPDAYGAEDFQFNVDGVMPNYQMYVSLKAGTRMHGSQSGGVKRVAVFDPYAYFTKNTLVGNSYVWVALKLISQAINSLYQC